MNNWKKMKIAVAGTGYVGLSITTLERLFNMSTGLKKCGKSFQSGVLRFTNK